MRIRLAPNEREWLTIAEAAAELNIGRNKCYELARKGVIRSAKLGTSIRIHRSALAELAQHEEKQHEPIRHLG